jgi:site-specific recombinase XerD
MSALAPTLEAFFRTRLAQQRQASRRTLEAYRDAFCLLVLYAHARTGKAPEQLDLQDLDAELISGFLDHLEQQRGNSVATRNARLTAIRSFYRFAAYRHPEHAALIGRVLAIPVKRCETQVVSFLNDAEIEALLAAPDRNTWLGRRDHALLVVALQTGLRQSELTGLRCQDLKLASPARLSCLGKGRKHRDTPLGSGAGKILRAWLRERDGTDQEPLFPSRLGGHLSPDAVQRLVAKHAQTASRSCPSLSSKHVTPHTLRHSCAMRLLRRGVDTTVIAMWLGHERLQSTQTYLHADLTIKQQALDRMAPTGEGPARRYRPPDALIARLKTL